MLMRVHSKSNYCLVLVLNSLESLTELPGTLISIWNMAQKNSSSIVVLEFLQLILKPLELTCWVLEHCEDLKVIQVTEVSIERQYFGVAVGS